MMQRAAQFINSLVNNMAVTPARRSSLHDLGSWADRTPLHEAAFQEAGAQVDVRTIHGSTPLCHACSSGSLECVKLLLKYGAKINPSLTALTTSPLHEACTQGNPELVRLLIASGANLEAYDVHFGPPLHIACAKAQVECVKELLLAGADVNSSKFHVTALHHAARLEAPDLIELLVEFGANTRPLDNSGLKPSDYSQPASPSCLCLKSYESNPLSLQQLCRITVRRALGTSASTDIGLLDISHIIKSYLQFH
ncbi:ankyrin repeat and SOCS box protein 13a.1 isoform X3 [Stigmatopora argus]